MQLKVFLKLNSELTLPIHYNHILQGIIYHSASSIDVSHTKKVHDEGFPLENYIGTNFKLFSFSKLIGKYKISGKSITFFENLFFEIRSADPYFIFLVYEGLKKNGVRFQDRVFTPRLELENTVITSPSISIRTLSPIIAFHTLESGKKEFLSPLSNEFIPYLHDNFVRKYTTFYGAPPKSDLTIDVLDVSYQDKCVTIFKNIYLTAWNGSYVLNGEPEALTFLYNVGLGSKNSQGFGLFRLLETP